MADITFAYGNAVTGAAPSAADLIRSLAATEDELRHCPRRLNSGAPHPRRLELLRQQRQLQGLARRRALVLRSAG